MSFDKDRKAVVEQGTQLTLLATTTVTGNTTVAGTAVTGVDVFTLLTLLLTISAKTFDASTTLDVYVQYSPDGGTTWDDLAHFAQVTNAAMGNGKYVAFVNSRGSSAVDRAVTDGTLAANSVRSVHWGDRLRVKLVPANVAGTDTITVKVEAFLR